MDVKKIKEKYNKELESVIQSDLPCDLERLLISILQCKEVRTIIQIKMNVKNLLMQEKKNRN